ncbi:MAG: hypothetical protein ACI9L9_000597 [Marivirga sp.]
MHDPSILKIRDSDNMKRILITLSQKWPEYLLEILVLIIGIYGAFAVENWKEDKQNQAKELSIIKDIHEEFNQNIKVLEKVKNGHKISYRSALQLKNMFPIKPAETNLDSVSHHLFSTLTNWTFEPVQGRIKWLVNSDNFDLIQNKALQEALISWERTYEDYHEDEQLAYSFNEAILFPYISDHFGFHIHLDDKRIDLAELTTVKFEAMVDNRINYLRNILYNETKELERLEALINKIVLLTRPEDM